MNHTEFLNKLIEEREYQYFLEIGYGTGANFKAIQIKDKTSIDPNVTEGVGVYKMTSDAYFEGLDGRKKYDLILIDGLHHADQVERDIVNSWKHLKKGGALVIHDVNPANEQMTRVPRETKQWCGTVYKAFDGLVTTYPELKYTIDPDDFGIALIEFDKDVKIEPGFVSDIDFATYKEKCFGS